MQYFSFLWKSCKLWQTNGICNSIKVNLLQWYGGISFLSPMYHLGLSKWNMYWSNAAKLYPRILLLQKCISKKWMTFCFITIDEKMATELKVSVQTKYLEGKSSFYLPCLFDESNSQEKVMKIVGKDVVFNFIKSSMFLITLLQPLQMSEKFSFLNRKETKSRKN